MSLTKESLPRIFTAIWIIGFVLTAFLLSTPPQNLPLYIGLACLAIIPPVLGPTRFRIFGVAALTLSLWMAGAEYKAGIIHQAKMDQFRQRWSTNAPPANQKVP